ncbi:MAG: 1-acyl-sn-glycerol-3-phosphate acyltransferase [Rhizobiaceae bacterium]|nr:1-acyl-sn-glycerol-3-phosphate acyltransferase [Rhizobiaceae bacterium]MCV0405784.1 1-acyl-sn-glycerol-3-phosphate acyltransferase [Rhizobiaceae bacterium]
MTVALMPFQLLAIRTRLIGPDRIPRFWHSVAARLLGFRVRLHGEMSTCRPLLVVSNHISWSDIVLYGAAAELAFVAKADMAKWPGFGPLAKLHRSVFVERENRRRSGDQAREVADRLGQGDVIVLFAEGTTTDGNSLLPFKSTLFGAVQSLAAAVPDRPVFVQPAAIRYQRQHGIPLGRSDRARVAWVGDEDLVPNIGWLLRHGAIDVDIAFGEPIEVAGKVDRKALSREAEARVRDLLRKLRGRP